jgi:hypothetical protein
MAPGAQITGLNERSVLVDLRGQSPIDFSALLASLFITSALCASGIGCFRKMDRTFANVI